MKEDTVPKGQKKKKDKLFNWKWTGKIFITAFSISIVLSFLSEAASQKLNFWIAGAILFLFIFIGILFDIIGTAVTASDPKMFNSMCSKQVRGAKTALKWVSRPDSVANFCNDVVGDISSVLSGSVGIVISTGIASFFDINVIIISMLVTSLTSALTVGGKSLGKNFAIKKANDIIFFFAKFVSFFGTEKNKKSK